MKYKTFKKQLTLLKNLLESESNRNRKISEAFGGDTQIIPESNNFIESMVDLIAEDMGDIYGTVDWLFWECLVPNEKLTYSIDDVEFDGTIRNIWLDLKGKLKNKHRKEIK